MARILVCDDEPGIRSLLAMLLGLEHDVTEAADGQEALDTLRDEGPFDLLVMDVMMPRLDGFSALKQIRADASLEDLSVVMLSARASTQDRDEGIEAGADAYVSKPFEPSELQVEIDRILTNK